MSTGPPLAPGAVERSRGHAHPILSSSLCDRASLLHKKAISAVHSLLCGHDADPRYTEAAVKARVAELYLPLLSLARDTLPRLHDFAGQWAGGRTGLPDPGAGWIPESSGQEGRGKGRGEQG